VCLASRRDYQVRTGKADMGKKGAGGSILEIYTRYQKLR